jgi:hypothetical protein
MKKIYILIFIFYLIILNLSCKKELILDRDYLTVADVIYHCSGSCDDGNFEWDNKKIKVKGHIFCDYAEPLEIYVSFMNDFILYDFRNNDYTVIKLNTPGDTAIAGKVFRGWVNDQGKTMVYITGVVHVYKKKNSGECKVYPEIILYSADDFYFDN